MIRTRFELFNRDLSHNAGSTAAMDGNSQPSATYSATNVKSQEWRQSLRVQNAGQSLREPQPEMVIWHMRSASHAEALRVHGSLLPSFFSHSPTSDTWDRIYQRKQGNIPGLIDKFGSSIARGKEGWSFSFFFSFSGFPKFCTILGWHHCTYMDLRSFWDTIGPVEYCLLLFCSRSLFLFLSSFFSLLRPLPVFSKRYYHSVRAHCTLDDYDYHSNSCLTVIESDPQAK